ncbi:MAG: hypothetical protein LBC77_03185, partial [Spirochaetaceae bacterium]|nr:hypothetical protein [Spirochaetaceae bacterium]
SYFFYGWWDWRFLILIVLSSAVDYCVGRGLAKHDAARTRKILLCVSLVTNLALLGFFKYAGFFVESFVRAFTFLGHPIAARPLHCKSAILGCVLLFSGTPQNFIYFQFQRDPL